MRSAFIAQFFVHSLAFTHSAWISTPKLQKTKCKFIEAGAITSIVLTQFFMPPSALVPNAAAINCDGSMLISSSYASSNLDQKEMLLKSSNFLSNEVLKQPTQDQPQIMIPTGPEISSMSQQTRDPIIQGLIFLRDQENHRPDFSDTLIITVTTKSFSEPLAGAKIPITKMKFPTQFNLYKENVLPNKRDDWESAISSYEDFIVTARVCPDISEGKPPCSEDKSQFLARGVSKAIKNLPGMRDGEVVRTAASIGL